MYSNIINTMNNKIIITACVGLGAAAISGISYNLFTMKRSSPGTDDGELTTEEPEKCKCIFANFIGTALTGGAVSAALTWRYYPK